MSDFPIPTAFIQNIIDETKSSFCGTVEDTRKENTAEAKRECVVDVLKDGICLQDGDHLLSTSAIEHKLVASLLTGLGRTMYRQANIALAEDASVVIRLRPNVTCEAARGEFKLARTFSRGKTGHQARDEIKALLVRKKVDPEQAEVVSMNELDGWSFLHVKGIFDQLPADPKDYPLGPAFNLPGASGLRRIVFTGLAYCCDAIVLLLLVPLVLPLFIFWGPRRVIGHTGFPRMTAIFSYIKPPMKMIRAAAECGDALCVNRRGQFKLLKNGYTALSHVDAQTFGWNGLNGAERVPEDDRGLSLEHLWRILDGISALKDEWVWLDNLAIPQRLDAELKSRCINHMPTIYQNASKVLILDALTLQMKTSSLIDVAVVLASGAWITRAWCYQELKLANWKNAAVVTANGKANIASMLNQLHGLARNDEAMYNKLFRTFQRLQKPRDQLSLSDVTGACQSRRAGLDEDYARAFYPTLGLLWKPEYDRVQAMVKLYESRPQQVARLAALHGPRGLPDPWGWAPAYLCGNEGAPRHAVTINDAGELIGKWWSVEITQVVKSFHRSDVVIAHNLMMSSAANPNDMTAQISVTNGSNLTNKREAKLKMIEVTDKKFEVWAGKVQSEQKTFLLCADSMNTEKSFAAPVLLVAMEENLQSLGATDVTNKPSLRARVFLSAVLTSGRCQGTPEEWTLV